MNIVADMCSWVRRNIAISVFLVFVFIIAVVDRLVFWSDVSSVNLNGWISFLHSIIPLVLLLIAPLFIFGRYSKCFYMVFFVFEMFVVAVGWFVRTNFEMVLDGDWIGIVLGSSVDEVIWFVRHYATIGMVLAAIVFMSLVVGVLKLIVAACRMQVSKATVALGLAGVMVYFYANQILNVCVSGKYDQIEKQIFGVHLVADSIRSWNAYAMLATMKLNPRIPRTVQLKEDVSDNVVGVFVLGESAARSHWSLYGYDRHTTPCMDSRKSELVIFKDLITPIGDTASAMRYIFTTRTIEHPVDLRFTMAQCLRSAGYDVSLFSNQRRWGEFDGDEGFDFAGCEPLLFMNEQRETNAYDDVLFSYCTNLVAKSTKKAVVFLHLQGSHVPSSARYPHGEAPYLPEQFDHAADAGNPALTRNHYDNSIWYTDKLLGRIIETLEESGRPSWLIYLSDHGETPSSKNWRTATDRDLWDIPFVVWTSKEFKEKYPEKVLKLTAAKDKPLQSDQLLYGLLDFAGVEGLGIEPCENFLDEEFRPRRPRLIQGGKSIYSWD